MPEDRLKAAVAAGVLASEDAHRQLLQATVEVARGLFSARASSVFLYDEETDELVFEAVAGEGSETLIGQRIPSSTGIAGWVLVTRQPLVLEDVTQDGPRNLDDGIARAVRALEEPARRLVEVACLAGFPVTLQQPVCHLTESP